MSAIPAVHYDYKAAGLENAIRAAEEDIERCKRRIVDAVAEAERYRRLLAEHLEAQRGNS